MPGEGSGSPGKDWTAPWQEEVSTSRRKRKWFLLVQDVPLMRFWLLFRAGENVLMFLSFVISSSFFGVFCRTVGVCLQQAGPGSSEGFPSRESPLWELFGKCAGVSSAGFR